MGDGIEYSHSDTIITLLCLLYPDRVRQPKTLKKIELTLVLTYWAHTPTFVYIDHKFQIEHLFWQFKYHCDNSIWVFWISNTSRINLVISFYALVNFLSKPQNLDRDKIHLSASRETRYVSPLPFPYRLSCSIQNWSMKNLHLFFFSEWK